MRQRDMLYKVPAVNQNQSIYRNSLAQRFKFVHSFQSLTFKHGFKADWFIFSFGFLHLTFTSDLIFPHWMSALAFFKYTSSSFTRQERNTGGFVLRCGGGWDSPPSLPESQLDVGRWDGKQVSPMTFGAQTLWASQPGVRHKLLHHSPSHPSPFILRQTCTNTHTNTPVCVIKDYTHRHWWAFRIVCLASVLHYSYNAFLLCSRPDFNSTRKDDPSDKEGNTK